ncbi:MAG: hypothetical protein KC731_12690 [Myxococcales bacterium]|nr:hypothetical protein [Myxococcales bacterium]
MRLLLVAAGFGALFLLPLLGMIVFVQARAKRRMAELRGPWGQLAQRHGGRFLEGAGFTGSQIQIQRQTHAVEVKMTLVSVMTAASVPYYPDGGTFTEVIVHLYPQLGYAFVPPGVATQELVDHTRVPLLAHLGLQAKIFLDAHSARIVFPGVQMNAALLDTAIQSLESVTGLVMQHGPLPAAA